MLGLLIVSHSEDAARGISQIAAEMGGGRVEILGVGGNDEGGLGVSVAKVMDALSRLLPNTEGVLVLPDLGSSVLATRTALEMIPREEAAKVIIADAPILEGAMMAAVEAGCGSSLEKVAETAEGTRNLRKIDR